MKENVQLWPRPVEGDFQPFLEMSVLDHPHSKNAGLVLVLPGGGYHNRAPYEGIPVAEKFNELGWHAATLEYRVSPSVFPAPQQDALRALKLIRSRAAEWGLNKNNIAILGFSAGGHLAACTGTIWKEIDAAAGDAADRESARPDAMILCYPVIYLTHGHAGSGRRLLGTDTPTQEELAPLDLDRRVTAETPPAFLWHTATDQTVDVGNSLAFAESMWKAGNTAELHVYPSGKHGLGLGNRSDEHPEVRSWPQLASEFLKTVGFTPAQ
ncbi:MAG: alpha/beta hydrolase [Lentisphaeria bacterium]|nr:alpha/beta hydrolase [Lentisphaeria bacterium]